ncbi:MAG: iron-containing alcohol dehydrogenase [Burkholderiales bacterium]|nr:iron-containing alcohol dehydrogenase [Burkholderiales bacterium]
MRSLQHVIPQLRVYCGEDSLQQLSAELARIGAGRAVVFCGRTLARHPDGLRLVVEALGDRYAGAFDGVQAHSPLASVLAGAETLRASGADAVVALGGGSAVVTARAASILLAEARDIGELCTQFRSGRPPVSPRLRQPKLPQLVLPTTPTTAYAKAGSAVLDATRRRLALYDPKTRAGAIFIHPRLVLSAPRALVMGAAVNAFSLAVQGIESPQCDPLADALLLHALRLLAVGLRKLDADPDDADTRAELMLGALLSGQGTDYAPTGLTSALAHAIGARFDTDNGIVNAILLPHAMRFNLPATADRLKLLADALGERVSPARPLAAMDAVERLFEAWRLPRRLRDIGVEQESLASIAKDALADWFLHRNPRAVSGTEEIVEVLMSAW